jgi:dienelactone hydrolase
MLQRLIYAIEHAHFRRETRRKVYPFDWGLEHVGGPAGRDADPRAFLARYAQEALAASDRFYETGPADRYELRDGVLTFPSALRSPFPENNTVWARWFPAPAAANGGPGAPGPAVVVLPQWNAQPDSHVNICRVLQRVGISALRMSLPYHDERKPPGIERADYLVSSNVGLTIQGTRQSVLDVRRALRWLEQQGHTRLGLLGTSIGSAVGFVTMCHEPALRAGAFLHVSTYFADVVATGLTTSHIWAGMEGHVTAEELRHYWAPISPFPYVHRLKGTGKKMLIISGRYDPAFPWELSEEIRNALVREGVPHERMVLPCGHYTLGRPPFSWLAGLRFVPFLRRALL